MGRNLSILSRNFSTGVSRHAVVKTPVPVYGIEGRYAAALFSAANKNGSLDAVEKDLKSISSTMESDPRLGSFLLDPSIKNHLKLDGIAGVCKTLKVSDLSKNLLEALAENNRLGFTNKKEVEGALGGFLKSGEKALISYAVDATIVGGMVVSIADKFVDMSMASKLTKYSDLIKSAA